VGLSALVFFPPRSRLRALVAAGIDLFANATDFLVRSARAFGTERITFWLGAGLAFAVR
jgi:hypothetical protein